MDLHKVNISSVVEPRLDLGMASGKPSNKIACLEFPVFQFERKIKLNEFSIQG